MVMMMLGYECRALHGELRRGYRLEEQRYEERRAKFYAFFRIPRELERFVGYGFLQCADAFLSVLTLLPVRFTLAAGFLGARMLRRRRLQPAEACDLLKVQSPREEQMEMEGT